MAELLHDLDPLLQGALADVQRAASLADLDEVRVRMLGKKGELTARLKQLGALDPDTRRSAGAKINEVKDALNAAIDARHAALSMLNSTKTTDRCPDANGRPWTTFGGIIGSCARSALRQFFARGLQWRRAEIETVGITSKQ